MRDNPYKSPRFPSKDPPAAWLKHRPVLARISLALSTLSAAVFVILLWAMISNDVFNVASKMVGVPGKTLFIAADITAVVISVVGSLAVLTCAIFGKVWQCVLCIVPGIVLWGAVIRVAVDFIKFKM